MAILGYFIWVVMMLVDLIFDLVLTCLNLFVLPFKTKVYTTSSSVPYTIEDEAFLNIIKQISSCKTHEEVDQCESLVTGYLKRFSYLDCIDSDIFFLGDALDKQRKKISR